MDHSGPEPLLWRKSRASQGADECVELSVLDTMVFIRDSRNVGGGMLAFTRSQLRELFERLRAEG
ncbi:DUF397 domain-containing protein [Actinomadura graeca]|uniref:DUF397 domain-containing protein n=1 Tax=Actinomadura graeca TaxID=2750812 RepID=A0ABX8QX84_9ACTN|nr:DUF397 domain-containing protein [Actinomadura graeca]QXJ22342.1 DUF397 domain-containing protein [Actinomadura graeca]